MKIQIPDTLEQASTIMHEIDHIQYHVVRDCPEHLLQIDFWLGYSKDRKTWALFADKTDYDDTTDNKFRPEDIVAWLTNPPKGNAETIGAILTDVFIEALQGSSLDDNLIHSIITSHPFPDYQTVAHYLPVAPKEWLPLPAQIVVDFDLSEGACLYRSIFDEYERKSFEEVIAMLFSPRLDGLLLSYYLLIREVVPLAAYEVDWPLVRRGKNSPYKRSIKVQGMLPWEEVPNTMVLMLYQSVPYYQGSMTPHYYAKPVVRLVVAGNGPEKAIKNWQQVSHYLRKLKQSKQLVPQDPL